MKEELCGTIKMETVGRQLKNLHKSQFIKSGNPEEKALKDFANVTQELCPQSPIDCRNDRFRKRILQNAPCGRPAYYMFPCVRTL